MAASGIVVVRRWRRRFGRAWFLDPRAPRSARPGDRFGTPTRRSGGKPRSAGGRSTSGFWVRRPCWRPPEAVSLCRELGLETERRRDHQGGHLQSWLLAAFPRSAHRRPDRSATVDSGQRHHVVTRAAADPTGPPLATDRSARRRCQSEIS